MAMSLKQSWLFILRYMIRFPVPFNAEATNILSMMLFHLSISTPSAEHCESAG